jgi:hypothetical protein
MVYKGKCKALYGQWGGMKSSQKSMFGRRSRRKPNLGDVGPIASGIAMLIIWAVGSAIVGFWAVSMIKILLK